MSYLGRNIDEWYIELGQDITLIKYHIDTAIKSKEDIDPATSWACAIKEASRLHNDLYRMAEVAGISREEIDKVRT